MHRHSQGHVSKTLAKAIQAAELAPSDDLLQKVQDIESDAKRILGKAENADDLRTAISAIRELTWIVELLAKLRGKLRQPQQVARRSTPAIIHNLLEEG